MNIDSITKTAAVVLADHVRRLESQGQRVIKLQTGEPDFDSFNGIKEAAYIALKSGETHYTYSNGMPTLRQAIANALGTEGVFVDPECVLVTHGAAGAIGAAMTALLEYGDEVLIPEPNWPTVDSMVKLNGGVPIKVAFRKLIELNISDALDEYVTKKTKAIYINTPCNPTGDVISQATLDELCNWAKKRNIYIIADEVYRFLQYNEKKTTSLSMLMNYERYIFVDSFSKKYAMTGWRIGYCVSSAPIIGKIAKAIQVSSTCIAPFVQTAATFALGNESSQMYAAEMYVTYSQRRAEALKLCGELGLNVESAEGGFYFFIKLPAAVDDVIFARELLEKYSVCVVPGSGFGKNGEGYIRITYAQNMEDVKSGIRAISSAVKDFEGIRE